MKAINLQPGPPATAFDLGVTAPVAPSVTLGAAGEDKLETVAVVAVARKLLVTLTAIVRSGEPFHA